MRIIASFDLEIHTCDWTHSLNNGKVENKKNCKIAPKHSIQWENVINGETCLSKESELFSKILSILTPPPPPFRRIRGVSHPFRRAIFRQTDSSDFLRGVVGHFDAPVVFWLVCSGVCTLRLVLIFCWVRLCCRWLCIFPPSKGCTSRFFLHFGLTFLWCPKLVFIVCFFQVPKYFESWVSCLVDFTWFLYMSLKVPSASP